MAKNPPKDDALARALKKLGMENTQSNRNKLLNRRAQDRARRDQMSFSEAFAQARKAHGGDGGTFEYNGKSYSTNVAKPKMKKPSPTVDALPTQGISMQIAGDTAPKREPIKMLKQQDANFYSPTLMGREEKASLVLDKISSNKDKLASNLKQRRLTELLSKIRANKDKLKEKLGYSPEFKFGGTIPMAQTALDIIDPMDSYGARSGVGATLSGAASGAAAGMALGPVGAIGGALVGGASSLISNNKRKKEQAAAEEAYQEALERNQLAKQQATLSTYPTEGIKGNQLYKKGGKINYNTGGMIEFEGASHEQGGIQHPAGIEVEGGETQIADTIYSDELTPSSDFVESYKYLGIKPKDTFADASKKLMKKREKYGSDSESDQRMLMKIDNALGLLESEQVEVGVQGDEEYARGGDIKKIPGQGLSFGLDPMATARDVSPVDMPQQYTKLGVHARNIGDFFGEVGRGLGKGFSNMAEQIPGAVEGLVDDPNALNFANYLAGNQSINQLELERQPMVQGAVPLNYQSNRTARLNNNALATREMGNRMEFDNPQTQRVNRAKLLSERLLADNQVESAEDAAYNSAVNANQQINANIDGRNVFEMNRAQSENMGNRNFAVQQRLNNRNAMLQGVAGNRAMDRKRKLDIERMKIIMGANPSGVGSRYVDSNEYLRKLLNRK